MDGHPDANIADRTPLLSEQGTLSFYRRENRRFRRNKCNTESIADGFEYMTFQPFSDPKQESIVLGKCPPHGNRVLFPETGAAFNIGEQEGASQYTFLFILRFEGRIRQ
jgi:hypothetical protein